MRQRLEAAADGIPERGKIAGIRLGPLRRDLKAQSRETDRWPDAEGWIWRLHRLFAMIFAPSDRPLQKDGNFPPHGAHILNFQRLKILCRNYFRICVLCALYLSCQKYDIKVTKVLSVSNVQ
jgi:hypothetical protein